MIHRPFAIFFLLLSLLITGCGSVRTYLHPLPDKDAALTPVELREGERRLAIKDTRGVTSIGGGYYWGLMSEDPTIAAIEYQEQGTSTRVFLRGASAGQTRVYYVNRAVFRDPTRPIGSYDDHYQRDERDSFIVRVLERESTPDQRD